MASVGSPDIYRASDVGVGVHIMASVSEWRGHYPLVAVGAV